MVLLIQNKVIIEEKKLVSQLHQKGFGEKKEKELVLDLKEALYLLEKKKIQVKNIDGKNVSANSLLKYAEKKEKKFYNKFLVFKDLRDRGLCVKTGFKFGFDFRVYERGKKPGEEHTKWVVAVYIQDERITMPMLSRMVRMAGNLHTALWLAVIDSENDINYYEIKRITP